MPLTITIETLDGPGFAAAVEELAELSKEHLAYREALAEGWRDLYSGASWFRMCEATPEKRSRERGAK